ncbi:MAG: hypothetical protein ACI9N9_001087 [Enterobacterales bacterium]|jgi:hypothetical protein
MKNDNHLDVDQDIDQMKYLLDYSSDNLSPTVKAKLNAARTQAVESLESSRFNFSTIFKPALAFMIPLTVVALVMIYPTPLEDIQTSNDIYADLELLLDEDELDFLSELVLYEWVDASN